MDISLSWDLGINIGHSGYPHEHKDQQGPLYGRRPQQQSANQQRVKAEITGKREEEMTMILPEGGVSSRVEGGCAPVAPITVPSVVVTGAGAAQT